MLCQSKGGRPRVSYSLSHCCETWFPLANFFLLGPNLPQFLLVTKAVTVLFIWKKKMPFSLFLSYGDFLYIICHSVSFMHWSQIDFVVRLNCTLSSPSLRACRSYTFCIRVIGKRLFHSLGCHPLWSNLKKELSKDIFHASSMLNL